MNLRVIPCLLLHKGGLVKSVKFKDYKYVGDPINAVKIFNEKEADEISIIDISATAERRSPNYSLINEIVSEAFMPVAYGGGVCEPDQLKKIFQSGVEKIIVNKSAHTTPQLISEGAKLFGSQSIVVSIDVKKTMFKGHRVFTDNGKNDTGLSPSSFAKQMESMGAGEILLNSIDRDGTYKGYDHELIYSVSHAVSIPVVAVGGASSLDDFRIARESGASAVAAGSMFVFKRPHQAVLINYPSQQEFDKTLFKKEQ
ncbi:MAG: imidazole glycerol phosphate synthase subunit HisF [Chitinophagaceae bacterium]|nr:imidazole glycerol phosphate synthase subunit HisF [Chitinophagaceae bacterium]